MLLRVNRIIGLLAILSMLVALLPAAVLASAPEDAPVAAPVPRLEPVAVGTLAPGGKHLRAPREDVVELMLRESSVITPQSTRDQVQSAVSSYYAKFYKQSDSWVSPLVQVRAQEHELSLATGGSGVLAIQPITATVLAMAVQFEASETISMPCLSEPIDFVGPMQGDMPHPDALDNNTIWYSPTQTVDPDFYANLAFGYQGVGRVRYDLTDPVDAMPGINLAGYTVQDYYDHVAGDGNVAITGTFQGWVNVAHTEAYYGAPQCSGADNDGGVARVGQVAVDALKVFSETNPGLWGDISPNAFWPRYDADGDGFVDAFWVVHAGMGQEAGGGEQGEFAIWSHSWALSAQGFFQNGVPGIQVYEGDPGTDADDIYVDPYTVQPENLDLGVLVEEFGHNFFGLPDLYTTDAQNSVGFWSEMSGGSWGGWIGGGTPVGMPLWFRMNAWCGVGWCNWQEPMYTRAYNDWDEQIEIGRLEKTPAGVDKGVRVNLPPIAEQVANRASTGKAAWSNTGVNNADFTLDRIFTIDSAAAGVLTFKSYWDIEVDYDYGYVYANGDMLHDTTGFMTDTNPNGGNLGWGFTGVSGPAKTVSFDLSAYKGMAVTLRLRYKTDPGVNNPGWWIDDVTLDGVVLDAFESATVPGTFPGWTNSNPGFTVVPIDRLYASYYLVEWRADTKYDKMVRTAYVTTDSDVDTWRVERVPYNIPAALVYYRNQKYPQSYSQRPFYGDTPSFGPKNKLLIVDMNYQGMRLGSTPATYKGVLNSRASSYDAGLTLQGTEAFTLSKALGVAGGPWPFAAKPAVTSFNDSNGYYAGFFVGVSPLSAGGLYYSNRDGSTVIPARGLYSTRMTDFWGAPYYDYYDYGFGYSPAWLGSGNPGDDAVQYGVVIDLVSKATDNSTATLGFKQHSVDFVSDGSNVVNTKLGQPFQVQYETIITNIGRTLAQNAFVEFQLDNALTVSAVQITGPTGGQPETKPGTGVASSVFHYDIPDLEPGQSVTVLVTATGVTWIPEHVQWLMTLITGSDGLAPREKAWWTCVNVQFTNTFLPMVTRAPDPNYP